MASTPLRENGIFGAAKTPSRGKERVRAGRGRGHGGPQARLGIDRGRGLIEMF
jgi:hypothetical protein